MADLAVPAAGPQAKTGKSDTAAAAPRRASWLGYLYFLRFSVAGWLFLPVVCGLDLWHVTSDLTRAILTLDSGWQVINATFFVVALGMVVLITARNTARNGKDRFESVCPEPMLRALTDSRSGAVWWTLMAAHVPTLLTLGYLAHTAAAEGEEYPLGPLGAHWWNIGVYFLLGILASFAFWYVVSLFYSWTYRPARSDFEEPAALIFPESLFGDTGRAMPPPWLTAWMDWGTRKVLARVDRAGYAETKDGPLWELHFLSIVSLAGILVLYLLLYPLTAPVLLRRVDHWWMAVAVVVVVLVFEISIANAGGTTRDGTRCDWAPWVKWTFQILPVAALILYIAALETDLRGGTVALEMGFPTLASLLVLANFFLWLLAGAAFFFDRNRIPVITAVVLAIFTPKWAAPYAVEGLTKIHWRWAAERLSLEHYYLTTTMAHAAALPEPEDAVRARMGNAGEPAIVVTASGGGIRAAEWTAELTALLENHFARDAGLQAMHYSFHDHLLLASGVSGGSVGLMPFLLEYTAPAGQAFPPGQALFARVASAPGCSSLEAVAWGLEYYDLYRLLLTVRFGGGKEPDRTWALTEAMNRNLKDRHCVSDGGAFAGLPAIEDGFSMTLSRAATQLQAGQMPAFTFNTTAAETGGRFLLANYAVPALGGESDFIPADSFLQVYTQPNAAGQYADLQLATAARLSATFPAVSSATRIPAEFAERAYHFVDGGYFDNDGTGSAIEFLKSALDSDPTLGTTGGPLKIVLFEIRDDDGTAVADEDSLAGQSENASDQRGWTQVNQLMAPLTAMWDAGHESISMRNRRELCSFEKAYATRMDIHHVVFTIPNDTDQLSPLSWNLTTYQRKAIGHRVWDGDTRATIEDAMQWIAAHMGTGGTKAGTAAGDGGDVCNVTVERISEAKPRIPTH